MPWARVLTQPTTTLTHLETKCDLTDDLIMAVCDHAQCLTHLSVGLVRREHFAAITYSGRKWAVRELQFSGEVWVWDIARLPQSPSPANLTLVPTPGSGVELHTCVSDAEVRRCLDVHTHRHTHTDTHTHTRVSKCDSSYCADHLLTNRTCGC